MKYNLLRKTATEGQAWGGSGHEAVVCRSRFPDAYVDISVVKNELTFHHDVTNTGIFSLEGSKVKVQSPITGEAKGRDCLVGTGTRCCDLIKDGQQLEAKVVIRLLCETIVDGSWVG